MADVLFEALCAALDYFDAGFLAVLPDARILHANLAAHEMLSDGWPIQSNGGFLKGCSTQVTGVLMEGLKHAAEVAEHSPSVDVCLCLSNAASPRGVAIATMRPLLRTKREGSGCAVAIFVTRIGSQGQCTLSGVAECFGLTPAETRTLHHFVGGSTVSEAGRALAISGNTVKTHLHNIFAKTRAPRQAQLIKLVHDLRLPLRHIDSVDATASGCLPGSGGAANC